jgi:uncharacterized protein (TIGR03067 family)
MGGVDPLQGSWRVVYLIEDGEDCDDEEVAFYWFIGDRLTVGNLDEAFESAYRIDEATNPKWLDLYGTKDKYPYQLGIYRLEGDRLTHCYADDFQERPARFESTDQNGWTLVVLERCDEPCPA